MRQPSSTNPRHANDHFKKMDTLLTLCHFCEIHGPQTLLSTSIASPHSTPSTQETGPSCANCSYNVPAATTTPPILRSRYQGLTFQTSRTPSHPLLREASVRALAVEALPRGQTSGSLVTNTDLAILGEKDPRTVNVTHIFRLPDPKARGQRRTYAFVAIGGPQLFTSQRYVQKRFETWADSVVRLAERHLLALQNEKLDTEMAMDPQVGSLRSQTSSATPSPPMSLGSAERTPPPLSPRTPPVSAQAIPARPPPTTTVTPISSFLSAKSVDPDGYPRSSLSATVLMNVPRTRSLADIVGDEFFFVRLHKEFCGLLGRLGMKERIGSEDGEFEGEGFGLGEEEVVSDGEGWDGY